MIRKQLDDPQSEIASSFLDKAELETLRLLSDNLISLFLVQSQQARPAAAPSCSPDECPHPRNLDQGRCVLL